jgi:hypothetical protein
MWPTLTARRNNRKTPWLLVPDNCDRLLSLNPKLFELSGAGLGGGRGPIFSS